jgi:hypothetical protein
MKCKVFDGKKSHTGTFVSAYMGTAEVKIGDNLWTKRFDIRDCIEIAEKLEADRNLRERLYEGVGMKCKALLDDGVKEGRFFHGGNGKGWARFNGERRGRVVPLNRFIEIY